MARRPSTSMQPAAAASPATLAAEAAAVQSYALAEKADAPRRAYRSDFEMFGAWCRARRNVEPLGASPDMVVAFMAGQASIGVRPSSLFKGHAGAGFL